MTGVPLRMAARTPGGRRPRARFTWREGPCAPAVRRVVAAAAGAAALAFCVSARADDAQQFELAKTRFDAGQYEEAAARFAAMLDPAGPPCDHGPTDAEVGACRIADPDLVERARGLAAAALVALGRSDEADVYIQKILLDNPAYSPNPAVFQPEVIDRFTAVRARIREQIDAAAKRKAEEQREARLRAGRERDEERRWIVELSRLAASERVVEPRSRWIAMLPFGAGQFQNGDTGLGLFFLISQALAGGTSIVSALVLTGYQGVDVSGKSTSTVPGQPPQQSVDITQLNSQISTATSVNRVAFGAWASLAAAGVVHAQVTFVPERVTVRQRAVPPPPPSFTAEPTISVLPGGGAFAGVVGRF
jgi:hypothetical protein